MKLIPVLVMVLFSCLLPEQSAEGQLFGSRSNRRSFTRQGGNNAGQIQGNERFLRGNRGQSFVGADQGDGGGFVGNQQGRTSGRIASPTGGIKKFADRSVRINRPISPLGENDVYPPLILLPDSLQTDSRSPAQIQQVSELLNDELRRKISDSIEVSVASRTARLRGVVRSSKDRTLAELLVLFEPGVDVVQNEIEVFDR